MQDPLPQQVTAGANLNVFSLHATFDILVHWSIPWVKQTQTASIDHRSPVSTRFSAACCCLLISPMQTSLDYCIPLLSRLSNHVFSTPLLPAISVHSHLLVTCVRGSNIQPSIAFIVIDIAVLLPPEGHKFH